jgi:hypothetical protein
MTWVIKAGTGDAEVMDDKKLMAFNKAREMFGAEAYVSNANGHYEVGITDAEGNHPIGAGQSWDESLADAENNARLVEEMDEDPESMEGSWEQLLGRPLTDEDKAQIHGGHQ